MNIQVIWESIISQSALSITLFQSRTQLFARLELVRANPGTNLKRCRVVENGTVVYIRRLLQRKIWQRAELITFELLKRRAREGLDLITVINLTTDE